MNDVLQPSKEEERKEERDCYIPLPLDKKCRRHCQPPRGPCAVVGLWMKKAKRRAAFDQDSNLQQSLLAILSDKLLDDNPPWAYLLVSRSYAIH